jgi:5-methylcytosine-specific restriction endonuclease McrA
MVGEVLVLNNDYEPLNICNVKRALLLLYLGKAEVIEKDHHLIKTNVGDIDLPSVLRLCHHVKRPLPSLKLSRRGILARDNYTCQYCGSTGKDMTIDHIIPKRRGGKDEWENLVCACKRCNMKKSDKTLQQSGLKLMRKPFRPRVVPYISFTKYVAGTKNEIWRGYLPIDPELLSDQILTS